MLVSIALDDFGPDLTRTEFKDSMFRLFESESSAPCAVEARGPPPDPLLLSAIWLAPLTLPGARQDYGG